MAQHWYRVSHHSKQIGGFLFDNHPDHTGRGLYQIVDVGDLVKARSTATGDVIELSHRRIFLDGRERNRGWSLVEWRDERFASGDPVFI